MIVFIILAALIASIVIALSLFVIIYLFVFQPFEVNGTGMIPTYPENAYVITDKISYRSSPPKRGDVIILQAPQNPTFDYIKRVIGLPGEKLMIQNGKVYINSKELSEPYILTPDSTIILPDTFIDEGEEIIIPEGKYFVLGDNREHSSDSRAWGLIQEKDIIGKITFCYAN